MSNNLRTFRFSIQRQFQPDQVVQIEARNLFHALILLEQQHGEVDWHILPDEPTQPTASLWLVFPDGGRALVTKGSTDQVGYVYQRQSD